MILKWQPTTSYAATVIVPAAVPIPAAFVIVDVTLVPLSLTVPLFNDIAFAPTDNTSPALVAALAAAIGSTKVKRFVPVPDD